RGPDGGGPEGQGGGQVEGGLRQGDRAPDLQGLERLLRPLQGQRRRRLRRGALNEPAVRLQVGTSGYSYKEWKGSFYPADMPEKQMLRFYAERFLTVEINNTFYRMPNRETLLRWAEETPPGFRFVLKAPQ